jgi:hypothetical protein
VVGSVMVPGVSRRRFGDDLRVARFLGPGSPGDRRAINILSS